MRVEAAVTDEEGELMQREIRTARRLVQLFRAERSGRFARRPAETARRLIDRRGHLVDELLRIDARRRSVARETPSELELEMGALAVEVGRAEQCCLDLLTRLDAELRRVRGEGPTTGLRDGAAGRLLGRG
jgi:hypothetical protein